MDELSGVKAIQLCHKASFKKFEEVHRVKLRTSYPFLKADQINKKIRESWKSLAEEDRQNYTKMTFKVLPVKSIKKKQVATKVNSCGALEKVTAKKKSSMVSKSPENINLEKLHGLCNEHSEKYESDFEDRGLSFPMKQSTNVLAYHRKEKCSSILELMPEIVEDTACAKQAILKSGQKKSRTSCVSFYNEPNIGNAVEYQDVGSEGDVDARRNADIQVGKGKSIQEKLQTYEFEANSSDDDGAVLLHRDDYNNDLQFVLENYTVKESSAYDIRQKHMVEKDDGNTELKTLSQDKSTENNSSVVIERVKVNTGNNSEKFEKDATDSCLVFKSPKARSHKGNKKEVQCRSQVPVPNVSTFCKETPVAVKMKDDTDKNTTPQMDGIVQQLMLQEVKKAPCKRRQSQQYDAKEEKEKAIERAVGLGRRVTRSLLAVHAEGKVYDYNDKFQDDVASNVSEVKKENHPKASQKKEKSKEIFKKHNVKISLRRKNNSTGTNMELKMTHGIQAKANEDITAKMNPFGDASLVESRENEEMNVYNTETIDSLLQNVTSTNGHTGDSVLKIKRKSKFEDSPAKLKIGSHGKPSYRKSYMHTNVNIYNSTDAQVSFPDKRDGFQDSVQDDYCSPQSSDGTLPCCIIPNKVNPTLVRVLKSLHATAVTSPILWSHSDSNASSPRLLSPALSGMTELSSASGSSQSCHMEDMSEPTMNKKLTLKPIGLSQVRIQQDLCDLFNDVPSDVVNKGSHQTTRLISSINHKDVCESTFSQLFQNDEEDSIF